MEEYVFTRGWTIIYFFEPHPLFWEILSCSFLTSMNFVNLRVGEHVWALKAQEQLKISMEVLTSFGGLTLMEN